MSESESGTGSANGNQPDLIGAAVEVLKAAAEGDLAARLEGTFDDPQAAAFQQQLNEIISHFEERTEDYHNSSMELAMGLSECFQVMAEVRAGNLDASVSEATTASSEELIASLGVTLNETVAVIREQIDTIERQRYAIRELSTPILQLWDNVLALPVIGLVDTRRSADIMERMLAEIVTKQSKYVILDITGVDVVDTRTADYFIKVIRAAELLGAHCFLTGIQPAVAQTLVEIGVDLSSLRTLRNLQEGLREALRQMATEGQKPVSLFARHSSGPRPE
ncbi:MAG: STAS domain-containing protein [bacterium]